MKVKTIEELQEVLDSDFAWRFKELSTLRSNITHSDSAAIKTNVRIAVVMLYAHWEGFIKNISEAYLLFVAARRLKYSELNTSFLAIVMKDKLSKCELTVKATVHNQAIKFLLDNINERAVIPKKDIINTHSNLNSDTLKEILSTIGIDYTPYELKFNQIDTNLVATRNTVAHGQFINLNALEFNQLYNDVLVMMSGIKIDVQNAATMKLYRNA